MLTILYGETCTADLKSCEVGSTVIEESVAGRRRCIEDNHRNVIGSETKQGLVVTTPP